ncbi:NAD(P)H-dependent oxidoreductase [Rhizobium tumorigenes]|uniref:NAD(P)H-dependent oxidoreductase n=1 Tax=Rhizobium tumorigenes TaxID=2041385 RepID=A0AAF1KH05_9HYPH|nr:NAD(P)H-dependent oxidoreductase [Rhizobium tumorigenes]WFR95385.1 NAD(P)H-dependent oxidoreductase [Rhizobium tumorigenes]
MVRVLVLFAHPGQRHSKINVAMAKTARSIEGITFVDLYAEYPTFNIDIDLEQTRLLEHDVLVLQFPIYWYSTPSLLKEWQDLVLEYGFAYGHDGDRLKGKRFMVAATAGGDEQAYHPQGRNHFGFRTLLSPLEQTANLCQMEFVAPFVLFSAGKGASGGRGVQHVADYRALLESLRDDRFDYEAARHVDVLHHDTLPIRGGAQ